MTPAIVAVATAISMNDLNDIPDTIEKIRMTDTTATTAARTTIIWIRLQMEELYSAMLKKEMEELVGTMGDANPSVYDGEFALMNLLKSVKLLCSGYSLKMTNVDHDQMIHILLHIKDIGIPPYEKRTKIQEELRSMGIQHLSGYLTSHRDDSYTIHITKMSFSQIRKIISLLFLW